MVMGMEEEGGQPTKTPELFCQAVLSNRASLSPPALSSRPCCGYRRLSFLVSQARVLMSAQSTIWRDRVECVSGLGGEKGANHTGAVCAVMTRKSRQCAWYWARLLSVLCKYYYH